MTDRHATAIVHARDNPFATECLHALPFRFSLCDTVSSWETLLERLHGLNRRAAIVGPRGAGKTTLLEQLGKRLTASGWRVRSVFFNEQQRGLGGDLLEELRRECTPRDIVLCDGSEQLGFWKWRRFHRATRRAGGLVITRHSPGKLPTLLRCGTNVPLLVELVRALAPTLAGQLEPRLPKLLADYDGNIRDVLRHLFDDVSDGEARAAPS